MAEIRNCFYKSAFIKRNVEKWFGQLGSNKGLIKIARGGGWGWGGEEEYWGNESAAAESWQSTLKD